MFTVATTTTNFIAVDFRSMVAVEEDGTLWEFDMCLDSYGDEMVGEIMQEDIAIIVVKHPSGLAWSTIVMAEFEAVGPSN